MGVSHATSGAAAGLYLAAAAPAVFNTPRPVDQLVFAAVCAGYGLLPDLDHPSSTATRRFGPASVLASAVVRPTSALVFRATALPRDRGEGTHRCLTHTALAAVALGWATNVVVAWWGAHAVWAVLFIGLALAVKGIDHLLPGPPSLAAAGALTGAAVLAGGGGTAPWLGYAVALGMLIHCLGDALTESGAPLLWPVPIGGRMWHPVRPPGLLRFRTGGAVEVVLLVGMTAAAVWLAVGVVPGGAEARDEVLRSLTY